MNDWPKTTNDRSYAHTSFISCTMRVVWVDSVAGERVMDKWISKATPRTKTSVAQSIKQVQSKHEQTEREQNSAILSTYMFLDQAIKLKLN